MDGVQLPRGQSHIEEAVYFLPQSFQDFLVLILSTSEERRAELTLEPPLLLNTGPLDWESTALTTRPLLHKDHCSIKIPIFSLKNHLVLFICVLRKTFVTWSMPGQ